MMKLNRTIALVLLVSLLCGVTLFGTVFATGEPQISVGTANGAASQTVSVDVAVQNNPGFVSMRLEVEYDDTYLTLTEVTDAGIFGVKNHKGNVLSWENDTAEEDITANGTIATLTFAVAAGAPAGDYPITVRYDNVNREDILNFDLEPVDFAVSGGMITVTGAVDVGVSTVDGAQIRTVGVQGLRFISEIEKAALEAGEIVEYGSVLMPTDALDGDINNLVVGYTAENGNSVLVVPAVYTYKNLEESIQFTALLYNIPTGQYTRSVTARAYVKYADGTYAYGDTSSARSIYQVAQNGLASGSATAEEIEVFQAIVDAVE